MPRSQKTRDSASDPLDRLTTVAATLFGASAASVALVDAEGLALRAGQGTCDPRLNGRSFTTEAVEMGPNAVMVVEDARADPRFCDHPLVTGSAGLRFYAGAVITRADGRNVGTLCVLDREPRPAPSEALIEGLKALARTAADILDGEAEARAQSEQLKMLGLAEAMSGVGHWRCDVTTGRVEWSDEVYRIHGVTRDTFDPSLDDAVAFYHPDDREEVRRQVEKLARDGGEYQFELRILRADGQERIVQSRAASERSADGSTHAVFGVFQDVTEAHRTLATARRNEARYRLLADNSVDVITRIRGDGTSRYISPAIESLLGWKYEEMSGRPDQYVHAEDLPLLAGAVLDVMAGGAPRSVQHRALHKDGSVVWVESRARAIVNAEGEPPEVIVAIRDISERKALEDQLQVALENTRRSEERYRVIADRSEDIIMTYSLDSMVTYASPALERIAGIRPEDMIGTSVNRLVHPEDVAGTVGSLMDFIRNHPDKEFTTLRYRGINKHGEVRHYETRTRVVRNEQGRCIEVQDVARDVTETRRLEAELRAALEAAETANQAKSEFLANMSHELRTPLTSIIGFAELLKTSAVLPEGERRQVERIATGSEALLSVINDILDYSKLEAQALEMDPRPFDPWTLAHTSGELMEAQRAAKRLKLTVEVDPAVPDALVGDEGRLRQVVLNFLSNAVKFTPSGEVRLSLSGRPVSDGWRLRVAVKDTGIGVDAAKLASLFDRFTQADQTTTRNYGGTGLGLAISKRLVEAMGGEIGATSEPQKGSEFWFEVTLAEGVGGIEAEVEPEAPQAQSARVLVADDAPANRELVSAILGHMGMEVETAADGAEAVEALKLGRHDLVLMDMHMPVMDGVTAARAIRALPGTVGRTPILALTANVQAGQIQSCMDAGMDGHLGKPIDFVELARAVTHWAAVGREQRADEEALRVA